MKILSNFFKTTISVCAFVLFVSASVAKTNEVSVDDPSLISINTKNQNVAVFFEPAYYASEPLETFTIDVVVGPVNDLMAFATEILFDPSIVTVQNITEGGFLKDGDALTTFMKTINNSEGRCIIAVTRLTSPPSGVSSNKENTVVTIHLKSNNPGNASLTLQNTGLIAPDGETIYNSIVSSGEIEVVLDPDHATISFNPDNISIFSNEALESNLYVSEVENLFAVALDIHYDPNFISLCSITEGPFLNENNQAETIFMVNIDNALGKATVGISRLNTTTGVNAHDLAQNLITISFTSLEPGFSEVFLTNVGLLAPDGVTNYPVLTEPLNVFVKSDEGFIYGKLTNRETEGPIQGVIVQSHIYQSSPSDAHGNYFLKVPYGYGYDITIESGKYEPVNIFDVHVPKHNPVKEINITLDPVPVYYGITTINPDPNPPISVVTQGGSFHRHYRVINTYNGSPLAIVPVQVTSQGFSRTFFSDNRGFLSIKIPSIQVGNGAPGSQADFSIVAVNNEVLPTPIAFTGQVTSRRYSKYWDAGEYIKVGGNILGIDISVEREFGGVTILEVDEGVDYFPQNIGIIRQARAGAGVGFKVKSPGVKGQLGPVSGGIGAEAGVGISVIGTTEDEYIFPYEPENNYQAVSKYILIADGNFGKLDNTLIRLLAVCEDWFSNEQTLLDAFVSDAIGLEIAAEANANANAGLDVAQAIAIGASANLGLDGNVGFKAKHNYNPPSFEYSFSASGRVATSAGLGLSMQFPVSDQFSAEFVGKFEVWNINLRRGLEFTVLKNSFTGEIEQYRLTVIKRNYALNLEEKISYYISGEQAIYAIQNLGSEITQLTNAQGLGSNLRVNNNTFRNIISKVFGLLYDLQTTQDGKAHIFYNIQRTNITQSSSFDISVEASATVLAANFGAGVSFEEGRSMIVEEGKWVWGKHFLNNDYSGPTPNVVVKHGELMSSVVRNVPGWLRALIGVVNFFSNILKDGGQVFILNETGSNLMISENAIPGNVDSISVTSWSWYGSSPDKHLNELAEERIEVFSSIRKRAEDAYGMKYGIGGFYQFEPLGLQLNDTCLLTIVFDPAEVASVDVSALGVYYEDKQNKRWVYLGGDLNMEENTVSVPITELSLFTLAPAMPYGEFGLNALPDSIFADNLSYTTIISDSIYYNNFEPVVDGTMFTIGISHGSIMDADMDKSVEGVQIPVQNGKLSFNVRSSHIAGIANIYAYSTTGSAHGSTSVVFYDTIPPASPVIASITPGNRMVKLEWLANTEDDLAGYIIYYDTDTVPPYNGIHTVRGQPSPLIMDTDTLRNIVGLFNDTTYYFAISAYDVSGNESKLSSFVSAKPIEEHHALPDVLYLKNVMLEALQDTCYSATQKIIVAGNNSFFSILSGGSAELIASESIHLYPGTTVEHGGYLLARIAQHDDDYCDIPLATLQDGDLVTTADRVPQLAEPPLEVRENVFFKLYPNPTEGTFKLELKEAVIKENTTVEVYDLMGRLLLSRKLPPQSLHTLSLEGQQPGIYIIRVIIGGKVGVERLIKR